MELSWKQLAARSQLGAALHLFLADQDPISVHVLASAGREVISGMARLQGLHHTEAFISDANPALSRKELVGMQNVFWNAMKHFNDTKGVPRDDEHLLSTFSDIHNDAHLFHGWFDYSQVVGRLPLEAQVFNMWFLATIPEFAAHDRALLDNLFPGLRVAERHRQKQLLRIVIEDVRRERLVEEDPRTEEMPLLLSRATIEARRAG